ncbi:MAG: Uma2 family endonuclease [Planctomycetia bacterium]|nr:Uma2 family endonuclease [Planctomycetia bacterium]
MAAITPAPGTFDNLGDLLAHLGGVPPARIRMRPPPGTATEADVLAAEAAPRKRLCELVDGVLVEKAMGFNESSLALYLGEIIGRFVRERNLGITGGEQGMLRLRPGRVRIPDVTFVSWDRLPGRRRPTEAIPAVAPDLAVEILSADNTAAEMEQKRADYFAAGTKLVWEIDPELRTVRVFRSPDEPRLLRAADTLDGGDVLPGLEIPLAELFAELDRQG